MIRSLCALASIALAAAIALTAGHAGATSREIRLGPIEVGVTPCADAWQAIADAGAGEGGFVTNATGAAAYKLYRGAFGFDFVQDGFVACDEAGRLVAAVAVTLPKRRANELADALGRTHRQQSRNLPNLGDGRARFVSATGRTVAEITYVHLSFSANLLIQTSAYEDAVAARRRREADDERNRLEGAF
jgi:hypothetical protein